MKLLWNRHQVSDEASHVLLNFSPIDKPGGNEDSNEVVDAPPQSAENAVDVTKILEKTEADWQTYSESGALSDEDLPDESAGPMENVDVPSEVPADATQLVTSAEMKAYQEALFNGGEIDPNTRGKIRALMWEYSQKASVIGSNEENWQEKYNQRAGEIVQELQSLLPNYTVTNVYGSRWGGRGVVKNNFGRIYITRNAFKTHITGTHESSDGLDVVEEINVPDAIKDQYESLKADPTSYVEKGEASANIIGTALASLSEKFKEGGFAKFSDAIDVYVSDNPASEQFSDAEKQAFFTAITTGEGVSSFKDLQEMMSKLDPTLLATMDQNGGVDGKLGYASLTAMLQISTKLIDAGKQVEEFSKFEGIKLRENLPHLDRIRKNELIALKEKVMPNGSTFNTKFEDGAAFVGELDRMTNEIHDTVVAFAKDGTEITLRQLMQEDPKLVARALSRDVTENMHFGDTKLERGVLFATETLEYIEKTRAEWNEKWVNNPEAQKHSMINALKDGCREVDTVERNLSVMTDVVDITKAVLSAEKGLSDFKKRGGDAEIYQDYAANVLAKIPKLMLHSRESITKIQEKIAVKNQVLKTAKGEDAIKLERGIKSNQELLAAKTTAHATLLEETERFYASLDVTDETAPLLVAARAAMITPESFLVQK